jgi:hypothetical protein
MTPLSLFDLPADPLPARSTDPATSRAAARRLPLRKRKAQTMDAIASLTGSFTADEVLDLLRVDDPRWERGWVSSRLSQLCRNGYVERCGVAEGRMGAWVSTYRLTALGREWLAQR